MSKIIKSMRKIIQSMREDLKSMRKVFQLNARSFNFTNVSQNEKKSKYNYVYH